MSVGMNIHKRIIGVCWVLFGALILSLLAVNFNSTDTRITFVGALVGLIYAAAGFTLLSNWPRSWRIGLPCAALSLFTVPVGTAIGLYYLWYYFRREKLS
ncbi:MAG: hypothetical protein KKA63_05220 [Gammaproteobacteria bacterium]|nr:hypothetical protein [Gammaproteobacteria bacterium]